MRSFRSAALAALPAVLLWLAPAAGNHLLYDRGAILRGEWWRLWTGHWVHFSISHLAWNLAVMVGAGTWLECLRPGWLPRYALVAAPLVSLVFLAGAPGMEIYGGLSGLASGVALLLALVHVTQRREGRAWWIGVLVLLTLKLAVDAGHATPIFSRFGPMVRPSFLAHLAGTVAGLAFFLARHPGGGPLLTGAVRPASPADCR